MIDTIKNTLNQIKQKHFFLYIFLYIVFLHAIVGLLAIIISYKKYSLLEFILVSTVTLVPFFLLFFFTYWEILLYEKRPKLVKFNIYFLNSLIIVLQFIVTDLVLYMT